MVYTHGMSIAKNVISKVMSDMRRKGWAKKTKEERSAHGKVMARGRWEKKNKGII